MVISIHKALAGLDDRRPVLQRSGYGFQSTRPSRASTISPDFISTPLDISIHKALAGLDIINGILSSFPRISIHKALAGLDTSYWPESSRAKISIHKALAGLD